MFNIRAAKKEKEKRKKPILSPVYVKHPRGFLQSAECSKDQECDWHQDHPEWIDEEIDVQHIKFQVVFHGIQQSETHENSEEAAVFALQYVAH